jgi:peptidyl-prolyl cis-trans isomerase C
MRTAILLILATSLLTGGIHRASAQDTPTQPHDPEEVFAYQGDIILTQNGIDAAFSKIPEQDRLAFIRDGARVDRIVQSLLRIGILAQDAMEAGYDQEPVMRERMTQAAHQELAKAWLEQVALNAPVADYEALAYEDYIANPNNYREDEMLNVSHILVSSEKRSEEEAQLLVGSLEQQLAEDPARFDSLIVEYSDDPAKSRNQGTYPLMRRGDMVKAFEDAAFALQSNGQISQPVKTEYGFHIIRLNERFGGDVPEFSEVKDEAARQAMLRHQARHQQKYLQSLLGHPIKIPDGAVEIMAKRYFGEDLELAPRY